jgi:3-deoxy-D-manno-octulosonic-acid transferase
VYDAGVALLVSIALVPVEWIKMALGRSQADWLEERLGRAPKRSRDSHPCLVLHAVSVGEIAAAGSLIAALTSERPLQRIIVTTGNREGRQAAELLRERFPQITAVHFLPWDRRASTIRWLRRIRPEAVIVIETEIWPNLFRSASELSIPLFIVSGRIYPGDRSRYRIARFFFRSVLKSVKWIGVQSEDERSTFISAGAPVDRVEVVGNLKHDTVVSHELPRSWEDVFERSNDTNLIVAGSTHHGEETWLIEALHLLRRADLSARLVLAPRHPRRADQVHGQTVSEGWAAVRWSEGPPTNDDWEVLIVDQVGPLAAVFQWADVAVIGGSLVRHGGHNPLEAARHGRAIIIGPYHEHFRDIVHELDQAGGIRVLPETGDLRSALFSAFRDFLRDARRREEMGRRAAAYCQIHQGVAQRYARSLAARM